MSRLQLAWEIGYALRDPKLNGVQLPGLYRSSAKSRLNILLYFAFILRDMKLNKVQFPQFLPGLLQEKSPLKKLPLKRNQQNLPPGGFAVTRTEARGQERAQRFSCSPERMLVVWVKFRFKFADQASG